MLRFIILVCILGIVNPVVAAEFNIKLRKTDINELKQQLLPTFDQNIAYLNSILDCLERGNSTDHCLDKQRLDKHRLDKHPLPGKNSSAQQAENRTENLKHTIQKNVAQGNLSKQDIIDGLKRLLQQAKEARACLLAGQTANELKDCIVKYQDS